MIIHLLAKHSTSCFDRKLFASRYSTSMDIAFFVDLLGSIHYEHFNSECWFSTFSFKFMIPLEVDCPVVLSFNIHSKMIKMQVDDRCILQPKRPIQCLNVYKQNKPRINKMKLKGIIQ